jgi:hypothetical protein
VRAPESQEANERELTLLVRGLVVVATAGVFFGVLVLAGRLPGGATLVIAMLSSAVIALLAARWFAVLRKALRATMTEPGVQESVAEHDPSRLIAYGPPLLISTAGPAAAGYLVGGVDLAVLFGLIGLIAAIAGLRAPPLAPVSESQLLRFGRRLRGRRR